MARRRIHACHMRRRNHAYLVRYWHGEEEDTCMSYEEEESCISSAILAWRGGGYMHVIWGGGIMHI
jgi:hypothetical protein